MWSNSLSIKKKIPIAHCCRFLVQLAMMSMKFLEMASWFFDKQKPRMCPIWDGNLGLQPSEAMSSSVKLSSDLLLLQSRTTYQIPWIVNRAEQPSFVEMGAKKEQGNKEQRKSGRIYDMDDTQWTRKWPGLGVVLSVCLFLLVLSGQGDR